MQCFAGRAVDEKHAIITRRLNALSAPRQPEWSLACLRVTTHNKYAVALKIFVDLAIASLTFDITDPRACKLTYSQYQRQLKVTKTKTLVAANDDLIIYASRSLTISVEVAIKVGVTREDFDSH